MDYGRCKLGLYNKNISSTSARRSGTLDQKTLRIGNMDWCSETLTGLIPLARLDEFDKDMGENAY